MTFLNSNFPVLNNLAVNYFNPSNKTIYLFIYELVVLNDKGNLFIDIPETKLTLGTSLNKDNIREGTDVYFDCMVVAEPTVYKVDWRHNVSTHREH